MTSFLTGDPTNFLHTGFTTTKKAFVGAGKNVYLGHVENPLLVLAAKNTSFSETGNEPVPKNTFPGGIFSYLIYLITIN